MLYKLNRLGLAHKVLRIVGNRVLWSLPEALKYRVGGALRRGRLPYRLVRPGDTVVQIGAPWDVLKAGRSRSAHFAALVGPTGRVVVIEPDPGNVAALTEFKERRGLPQMVIVDKGAWSHKDRLRFLVNRDHPASNLIESVYDSGRNDLGQYDATEINVDSVDHILAELGIAQVRLVSITTNGSERQILEGMKQSHGSTTYIATVGRPEKYRIVEEYGFVLLGEDDRGYLFSRPGEEGR